MVRIIGWWPGVREEDAFPVKKGVRRVGSAGVPARNNVSCKRLGDH